MTSNSTINAYRVIKRDGKVVDFDAQRIKSALTKAFLAAEHNSGEYLSKTPPRIEKTVAELTDKVINGLKRRLEVNNLVHIEDIQDQVELELMRAGEHKIARDYVLYREKHAQQRAAHPQPSPSSLQVTDYKGVLKPLDAQYLYNLVHEACAGLKDVDPQLVISESLKSLFDGIAESEINRILIMTARTLVEKEPNYTYVAARLLLDSLRTTAFQVVGKDQLPLNATANDMSKLYPTYFKLYIQTGIHYELLTPALKEFDLEKLAAALIPERDFKFTYLGFQTLFDRYFLHWDGMRFELPQAFFMRVAMGLSLHEQHKEERAIDFYNLLSTFDFMSSTPTLFNAATLRSQLSSCYLTTIPDDLTGIYNAIRDNALLSKFAGGLGNDWTNVRAMGSRIKGTNGKSQGVVPFMKVANDTLIAVNQCFSPETLIYTADGVKTLQQIKPGDLVLGQRGEYREVLEKFTYLHCQNQMLKITIEHSIQPLNVSNEHPFWAIQNIPIEQEIKKTQDWLSEGKVKPSWVKAGYLKKGDYVAQVIPKEINVIDNFNEEDARLYGIMLGAGSCSKDGSKWKVCANLHQHPYLTFVKSYLTDRQIHYWIDQEQTCCQIHWTMEENVIKNGTTGQIVNLGKSPLPFTYDDLYNADEKKCLSRRFSHLPPTQTLALIQGLLETNGDMSKNQEIYFTNTSQPLIEGLRYQCLRLGIPTTSQYHQRNDHKDIIKAYELHIPIVPKLAEKLGGQPVTKYNWLEHQGCLFSQILKVEENEPLPIIYDLKVEGDETYMTTAALVHNGGRRKGSGCAYLETWHLDIEEFLELRKNTGDDRRRTHDMNTANWIPDLFMVRVQQNAQWTLFSPDETPDLHELYGKAFETAYLNYEAKAAKGEIKLFKKVSAVSLWRKMLTMLFETGHPWMTFKDPCNLRSPQQHVGVVHSSNLCTEITLNTSEQEIAVCNLGSINLSAHVDEHGLKEEKLARTVQTAMRMLDNVIDLNFYPVPQAEYSNLKHRPVGLGIMGFQDALYKLRIPYASQQAVDFADKSMELISYYAIEASVNLAKERGAYSTFEGSLWSKGILPIDSLQILQEHRDPSHLKVDFSQRLDWEKLREQVKQFGMRNSNCMAIAPTATISNICGVTQSIEPAYQNLFVKSNLSGEFIVVNPYLAEDLKKLGLWDEVMVNDLKYFDGSVRAIDRVPKELKELYATAFEIDASWLIEAAARRQKWIDQAQSLNLYMKEPSGARLDNLYRLAWLQGLKTTYYLRTLGATHVEKKTVKLNTSTIKAFACSIDDPECEACQ